MGFLGLAGLVAILVSFIALGLSCFRRHIPDERGELVPGLLATIVMVAVHINFEFVFMDFVLHYLFAMTAGMLVAVAARARNPGKIDAPATLRPATASGG